MSERHPWTADRELDTEGAARAIREAVPELADVAVRPLGWGWDFDTYEADGRWVFRFPRRAEEQDRLRKDLALHPWVAERVDVPMPRYAWGPLRAPSFPYIFSGYPKLEGGVAAFMDPRDVDLQALGRNLGAMLAVLHALPVPAELVTAAQLDAPRLTMAELRDSMSKHLVKFRELAPAPLADRAERFFADPDLVPQEASDAPCLIHNDLHCEHLLLDPEAPEEIRGILDWSDAALADAAREFACIYSWGGDELLAGMLGGYGGGNPALEVRARFCGTCLAFQDWDWCVRVANTLCRDAVLRVLDAALPP